MKKKTRTEKQKSKKQVKKAAPKSLKVLLDRHEFEAALKIALTFISSKGNMPILQQIHFKKSNELQITATDLDTTWFTKLKASGDSVESCIPANILYSEVKALHGDIKTVNLTFEKDAVSVNGRCRILTLPAEEYPAFDKALKEKGPEYNIPDFHKKLKPVICASGDGDTRYTMNSIYLDTGGCKIVATDGHRLHFENIEIKPRSTAPVLINSAACSKMTKYSASDKFRLVANHIVIDLAGGTMVSRLVEGDFPKVQHVLESTKSLKKKVTFDSAEFLKILEGALPLSGHNQGIVLRINGKMKINSSNPDLGNYEWSLPCATDGIGKDEFTIGFNARYLIDALRSYPAEKSVFKMGEELDPCTLNQNAVIMPMRV